MLHQNDGLSVISGILDITTGSKITFAFICQSQKFNYSMFQDGIINEPVIEILQSSASELDTVTLALQAREEKSMMIADLGGDCLRKG
eukprot:g64981.t1